MKKINLLVILLLFAGYFSMAQQTACYKDVEYTLVSLKQVPKARTMMEEKCFPGNESNADVWLLRGNVFIRLHENEQDRYNKEPNKYVIRFPDAVVTANESFYKALELKKDIKPNAGLLGPKDGQVLSADIINNMAKDAFLKKDYNEAIKLYNLVVRSFKVDIKEYGIFLAYAYSDLADCYKAAGDDENYKKLLLEAAKLNVADPYIYLSIYDIYKQERDTVKCGEILTQARKIIPDSIAIDVKGYELDYFAMMGDSTKLINAAVAMYEQNKNNIEVIKLVSTHLINNKEYTLAREMIDAGLKLVPNDFDLTQLMGYAFNSEALDYFNKTEELKSLKKYTPALEYRDKYMETYKLALPWAEKAYQINAEDRDNNIMLQRIYVRLEMEVPAELKEKVDSYYR